MAVRLDSTADVHVPKGANILQAQDGSDVVGVTWYAGDPNGNVAADIGSFVFDTVNGTPWYKTTDTVNTGWAQIDITPTADSSITEGVLALPTSSRTVDMNNRALTINNFDGFTVSGSSDVSIMLEAGNLLFRNPGASVAGGFNLADADGSHTVGVRSPVALTTAYNITLPTGPPASNGQYMTFTTTGVATFVDPPVDANITSGSLVAATGARSVPLDSNSLAFTDVNGLTFTLDDGAATLFTTDTFTIGASTAGTKPTLTLNGITGSTSIVAANAATAYTITLPAGAPASNGQIMSFTTGGVASFINPPDTNITTGSLAAATGTRNIDFGTNDANFNNVGAFNVDAVFTNLTGSYTAVHGDGTVGVVRLYDGDDSHYVSIVPRTVSATYQITLPAAAPSANGQVLSFQTNGLADFVTLPNITEGTLNAAGADRTVPMGGWDLNVTNVPILEVSNGASTPTRIQIREDSDNGSNYIGLTVPSAITTSINYTLPEAPVANGQVLQANTDGTMSWKTLNAPMHLEGNLDVGGGATFSSPAGADEGSWYIITNAAATGTTFGTGGPKVFTGDSVVVKDGVASTTLNDGTQWLQIDSGTDVTSVQVGTSGSPATGAVVISDASTTALGIVELATTAETLAGSDSTRAITSAGLDAKVSSYTATYPSAPVGAGGNTVITHNLGSREVSVTVYDSASKQQVIPEVSFTSTNTITISHALATTTNEFTVYVSRVVKQ